MQYGIHLFPTEYSIQPGELALLTEERGFESVWFSEHTHIPVDFLNSGERGPALPDHYWQTYDPFIASTLAATTTTDIKIGTGVSLVLEHDTIALAKSVATIDQVSGGRFIFGVGAGWLAAEMANHGVNYRTRYRRLDEQLSAMKMIWTEDEAEYQGEFYDFSKMKAFPKPHQNPHPPIIAGGGAGPKSLEFVVHHCAGWMPILGNPKWADLKSALPGLHQRAVQAGRDPESIELSIFCWFPPDRQTRIEMDTMGVKKIVISLAGNSREKSLPLLDEYAKLNEA